MSDLYLASHPTPLLRQKYLHSLEEPQEWFLEELIGLGQAWALGDGTYGVVHEGTLVEFFSADPADAPERLRRFHVQNGFSAALVKSYDHDLVRACDRLGWSADVGGLLFRKRTARPPVVMNGAQIRPATPADGQAIWEINDAFFSSAAEIAEMIGSKTLWAATLNGQIAGCGVANPAIPGGEAVDIGMMVAPGFRRIGLGTYIISELATKVAGQGLRPICGCGAGNLASRATLQKAGFVTEHQLLRFTQ